MAPWPHFDVTIYVCFVSSRLLPEGKVKCRKSATSHMWPFCTVHNPSASCRHMYSIYVEAEFIVHDASAHNLRNSDTCNLDVTRFSPKGEASARCRSLSILSMPLIQWSYRTWLLRTPLLQFKINDVKETGNSENIWRSWLHHIPVFKRFFLHTIKLKSPNHFSFIYINRNQVGETQNQSIRKKFLKTVRYLLWHLFQQNCKFS